MACPRALVREQFEFASQRPIFDIAVTESVAKEKHDYRTCVPSSVWWLLSPRVIQKECFATGENSPVISLMVIRCSEIDGSVVSFPRQIR